MNKDLSRNNLRKRRQRRIHIFGTAKKPRLSVFKSTRRIFAQLIDDEEGKTIAGVLSKPAGKSLTKQDAALEAGRQLAVIARKKGIETAAFDRGGYKYHGRVKAIRVGAEKEGLVFSFKKKKK